MSDKYVHVCYLTFETFNVPCRQKGQLHSQIIQNFKFKLYQNIEIKQLNDFWGLKTWKLIEKLTTVVREWNKKIFTQ